MSVIGTHLPFAGRPDDLIKAVREEIYTEHPDAQEMDIAVALYTDWGGRDDRYITKAEEPPNGSVVVDYRVTRVDKEILMDKSEVDQDDPSYDERDYLIAMYEWARSVEGANNLIWVHRHPGDHMEPSPHDVQRNGVFVSLDLADERGYNDDRTFYLGGTVIADEGARPIGSMQPEPVQRNGVDGRVTRRLARFQIEDGKHEEGDRWHQLMLEMADLLDEGDPLLLLARAGDESAEAQLDVLRERASEIKRQIFEMEPHPFASLLDEIRRMLEGDGVAGALEEMGLTRADFDLSVAEPVDVDPPKQIDKPKGSIFDLPELGADDGPEIRWN